jgi:hypothetical protein
MLVENNKFHLDRLSASEGERYDTQSQISVCEFTSVK